MESEQNKTSYINDINQKPEFDRFVHNYEILQAKSKVCADLNHFYLSSFLNEISHTINPLSIINNEINGLKHYPYAFLVLTDLASELS